MKLVILATVGICVSLAATPNDAPKPAVNKAVANAARPEVTQDQIDKWMMLWRKRLSLEDWDVTAEVVRAWELRPETLGNLHWNSGTKTAVIRVLDPRDYDLPAREIPSDIEYTILHELVHLQLAVLPREAPSKNIEEGVVNRISEALMALDKGPRYKPRTAVAHLPVKDKSASEASREKHVPAH